VVGAHVDFNFTATDDQVMTCTLYGNFSGSWGPNKSVSNVQSGQETNISIDVGTGTYAWNVRCEDPFAGASFAPQNYTVTVDATPPVVTTMSPLNGSVLGNTFVFFKYNVSETYNVSSCSLYLNGTLNETDTTIQKDVEQSFNKTLDYGNYSWQVRCVDEFGNVGSSSEENITIEHSTLILVDVSTDQPSYEIKAIVPITTHTTDKYGYDLVTNVTTDVIHGVTQEQWWNTSWKKRKPIRLSNDLSQDRADVLVEVNVSGLGGAVSSCANEVRVVYQDGTSVQEVPVVVVAGDDSTWCQIRFFANVSANAVNEERYFMYYNNSGATNPGYTLSTTVSIFFDDMEVGGAADAGNWSESASLGVETWGLDSGVAR
ncbi:hypothetical protein D6783_05660, partial [Candidatus Woesearchaeota archaeon]